ncbi:hypothetical protein [Edaphocola aurantiacus]|uniref:hypothetical protein n=1 Tax=Edaphocola aurantiacus TaxID=2601682 RepID=UPI001C982904|nr:hypothetical protein [Edaphocola aurantiacus]
MQYTPETTQEQNIIPEYTPYKLFKTGAIGAGAFFGGIMAGAILLSENFKILGQKKQARNTLLLSAIASFTLGVLMAFIPAMENIPRMVIPLLSGIAFQLLTNRFQKNRIEEHIENGGTTFSFWRVLGMVLLGTVCTAILIAIPIFISMLILE